ncbi:MAG: tetratricopeptide repeat protein [Gemmatimonadota bacterium]
MTRRWSLLAALALTGCGEGGGGPGSVARDFPPPPPAAEPGTPWEDFVGAEACADCHERQYRAWSGSTHGQAGGPPGRSVVIAPFDGRPIRFADAQVVPRIRDRNIFEFVVRQDGHQETTYRVDGVIGGGHMLGGGTQGFLTRLSDGTERFLPWDWSRQAQVWFCNTGSRLEQGWVPIDDGMRLADCGDWPPIRPIGTVSRFANCQECHGSQIRTALDPEVRRFHTEYTTLRVNCESCHGPGRQHVAWALGDRQGDAGPGLESLSDLGKERSLEVCFRCHALKDVIEEGYRPGDSFVRYYALKFPVLGDRPYFADGRVRSFAYQANHLASACYLQGPMDCASCHEPHGLTYWDTDRRPLASPLDDGQCTSCHPSKLVDPATHTFHPEDSDGSRCVSCHMPYLQHPEVGTSIPFARSDHTIAIPRPAFDADLGITGACAQCHADIPSRELQRRAAAWWGELKPHRPLVQGQIGELRARNLSEAAELLLHPEEVDPLVQFQALSTLLVGYLPPDAVDLDPEVDARLRALSASPDLDVRALALASLHWVAGDRPEVRPFLIAAVEQAEDDGALRGRWLLALGFLGDHYRDQGDFDRGETAYRKGLELRPDDTGFQRALGVLRSGMGDFPEAVRLLRASLANDSVQSLGWVNPGLALVGAGELEQRGGRLEAAAREYRAAIEADPGLGRAHFELARVYIRLERFADALPHARRAVEFLPDHAPSRQMLQDLIQALGDEGNAP